MKRVKTFLVPIVLWYLRLVSRLALIQTRATIIGIAGSVGKTSTREAIYAILKDIAPTHMVSGNSETGVPLGLIGLFPHSYSLFDWARMLLTAPFRIGYLSRTRYIIIEMGIDDPYPPKNMEYLLTIVKPHFGIITEESAAHSMQFEKILKPHELLADDERLKRIIEAITTEDVKMLTSADIKIINGDNTFLSAHSTNALTFGSKKSHTIQITHYVVSLKKTTFTFVLGDTEIHLQFNGYVLPKDLAYVFAPAILTAHKLNIPSDVIKDNLEKNFVPPKGRESVFEGIHKSIIIDSSYNASRPSVLSFLELIQTLKKQTNRHTIVVLADMLELGNQSQIEHEAVARAIDDIPDTLYLVGPLTKRFILPKVKHAKWFPSIIELNVALAKIPHRSLLLFKGSQGNLWLEESIKLLLANNEDVKNLCRQNAFWKRVKLAVGRWVAV